MYTNEKSYNEMSMLDTFDDRFLYLKIGNKIGDETFGFDRYINQEFYRSNEWRRVRSFVIARDNGCDLGIPDRPIIGKIYIHHINPITQNDIELGNDSLLDPNNLVCVSMETHNAIHFGDSSILNKNVMIERRPNDTSPWLKEK